MYICITRHYFLNEYQASCIFKIPQYFIAVYKYLYTIIAQQILVHNEERLILILNNNIYSFLNVVWLLLQFNLNSSNYFCNIYNYRFHKTDKCNRPQAKLLPFWLHRIGFAKKLVWGILSNIVSANVDCKVAIAKLVMQVIQRGVLQFHNQTIRQWGGQPSSESSASLQIRFYANVTSQKTVMSSNLITQLSDMPQWDL